MLCVLHQRRYRYLVSVPIPCLSTHKICVDNTDTSLRQRAVPVNWLKGGEWGVMSVWSERSRAPADPPPPQPWVHEKAAIENGLLDGCIFFKSTSTLLQVFFFLPCLASALKVTYSTYRVFHFFSWEGTVGFIMCKKLALAEGAFIY